MVQPRTLYEKIWDAHVVDRRDDGTCLIYIDRHLIHEVTSPQAFENLRLGGRKVRRPDLTLAVPDHNLPTTPRIDAQGRPIPIADPESAAQLAALPAVEHCWFVAGEETFVVKVRVPDGHGLEAAIRALNGMRGVARTRTSVVLSTKFEDRVPVTHAVDAER